MSLDNHIRYLIEASALIKEEDLQLERKFGITPSSSLYVSDQLVIEVFDIFDPQFIKCALADRPEVKKLEAYLNELDKDTLVKLLALLYFGRDDIDNPEDIISYVADFFESRARIIHKIVEKRGDYPVYLDKALEKFKELGIDVDSV
jgi:hypothetical protein